MGLQVEIIRKEESHLIAFYIALVVRQVSRFAKQ
jgi:hypothetical protein